MKWSEELYSPVFGQSSAKVTLSPPLFPPLGITIN
jgi:hypothetical protein